MEEITSPSLADLCKPPIKPLSGTPAVNPPLEFIPVLEERLERGESKKNHPPKNATSTDYEPFLGRDLITLENVQCDSGAILRKYHHRIVDTEAERVPPSTAPVQTALDTEQGSNLPPVSDLPPPAEQGSEGKDLCPPSPSSIDLELGPLPVNTNLACRIQIISRS